MRIGMITGEFPPMEGGVGAFTRELGRAFVASGHEVHVFTRQQVSRVVNRGIRVEAAVEGKWGWQTLGQVAKWAANQKIDLMNIQFQTAAFDMHPAIHWLPSHIKQVPVVVTFHDLREPYLFPKAHVLGVRQWIVRKLAISADGVISTDRTDETHLRYNWRIKPVKWIPIGSNVTAVQSPSYDRNSWRKQLGVSPHELLISYFGFLNESKGGLVLIDALARLHEINVPAHLLMIGGRAGASDPTNQAYGHLVDERIAANNLASFVHWTGFVDDAAVSGHFMASDITALPYLDGVSLRRGTLMAALAHGRAIVTTESHEYVPELDGRLVTVPANDAVGLAAAISDLWRDPQRLEQLGQAALQTAVHFRWDVIAQETLAFFSTLSAKDS